MLHARDEDLLRVESLPVLPVYSRYPYRVLRAHCSTQRREVIVRSTIAIRLVFIQRKGAMEEDQTGMVLLMQQEEAKGRCRNILRCPPQLFWQTPIPATEFTV